MAFVIQVPELINFGDVQLQPLTRYVMIAGECQAIAGWCESNKVRPVLSHFNNYERRYSGQCLSGKRIAILRGAAFGDTLITTAIACYLRRKYPECRVDVYCQPRVQPLWRGLPVHSYGGLLTFDAARQYDYHVVYESMFEMDWEPDQANCYDNAYRFIGVDPESVPVEFKRPQAVTDDRDRDLLFKEAGAVIAKATGVEPSAFLTTPYIVYQLQASNHNRSYPPGQAAEFVNAYLDRNQGHSVVLVGESKNNALMDFGSTARRPGVVNLVDRTASFRSLYPLVESARCVVGPDSSVAHLSAAFGTKTVTMWGLFHPNDRVKFYPNHTALNRFEVCPFAPCHNHDFELPVNQCRAAANNPSANPKFCNALRAITPAEILAAVEKT
jgi:ADP-heptose:LPS heptosyltransferase